MAYKRKLEAIGYVKIDNFNVFSDEDFRTLVVYLEDQVIRHLPIEARTPLRKIHIPEWDEAFTNYLKAVACPFTEREEVADWLLGLAIRLEYGDNVDQYKNITAESINQNTSNVPQVTSLLLISSFDNFM